MAGVEPIPELWTGLISSRRQRQKCADDVEELKRACEKDCAKQHVIQCEGCYHKVLERMRQRYADSTDPEWFSERKAFISELDGVFNDAKQYRNTVSGIEARVEAEKEAWYRWVFRKHPEYLQVSEDGPPLEVLREMLDDPECNRTDLIAAMWRGVGKTDNWQPKLEEFVEKVNGLAGHEEELRKLYLSRFFLDEAGNPVEHADECTRAFKQNQQKTIQGIATQIALENQRARSSQPQRDNHVKRLDELRRAKTAFEQNRMQAKRLQNQAQSMPIKEEFKVLPRCVSCKNVVAREDVISCSLCQTYLQMGGNGGLTLYCTVDCYQEGHVSLRLLAEINWTGNADAILANPC